MSLLKKLADEQENESMNKTVSILLDMSNNQLKLTTQLCLARLVEVGEIPLAAYKVMASALETK